MKTLSRSFLLGCSLVFANIFLCNLFSGRDELVFSSAVVFFVIVMLFLICDSVSQFFIKGVLGAFFMFAIQIFIMTFFGIIEDNFLFSYVGGFYGCMAAVAAGLHLTIKNEKRKEKSDVNENTSVTSVEAHEPSKSIKTKLIVCAAVTAVAFILFITPIGAGISVPIFTLIEFALFYYAAPDRKKLYLFIPIFAISLNSLISASDLWDISNVIVSIILYASIFVDIGLKTDSLSYFGDILEGIFFPLSHFALPFRWASQIDKKKADNIKRIGIALFFGTLAACMLTVLLSNADMVFSLGAKEFLERVTSFVSTETLAKIILGAVAGLYIFGILYRAHTHKSALPKVPAAISGDHIIINTILIFTLSVYTLFVIVQFKYLFCGAELPEGLNYTQYARKGFFELLALTGINIAGILAAIKLTKSAVQKWKTLTKTLCHYMCAVTCVLLVSSFYRMLLYTGSDGLTRLRLFVLGFLVFEAAGLIVTFFYIAKPKFNIAMVYTVIAMSYYCILNVVPTDYFIAKNQIDKYLSGERDDLEYIFTLSADAVPAMRYLADNTDDAILQRRAQRFISQKIIRRENDGTFRSYNISFERAKMMMQINK